MKPVNCMVSRPRVTSPSSGDRAPARISMRAAPDARHHGADGRASAQLHVEHRDVEGTWQVPGGWTKPSSMTSQVPAEVPIPPHTNNHPPQRRAGTTRDTPGSNRARLGGLFVPGVEIHSSQLAALIKENLLFSASLRTAVATASALVTVSSAAGVGTSTAAESLRSGTHSPQTVGGMDVQDYNVALEYRTGTTDMNGRATLKVMATQNLPGFALNFMDGRVSNVTVNGRPAKFKFADNQIRVAGATLTRGTAFTVVVDFVAGRAGPSADKHWVETDKGFTQNWSYDCVTFPCGTDRNDRATYTFRITTPAELTGLSVGELTATKPVSHARKEYNYKVQHPIRPDSSTIAVGPYSETTRPGPHGTTLRAIFPTPRQQDSHPTLNSMSEQMTFLTGKLGPYPYESYGIFSPLRGRAHSSHGLNLVSGDGPVGADYTAVHEFTHQWFGESVGSKTENDEWIREGHAHFYGLWGSTPEAAGSDREFSTEMRKFYEMDQGMRERGGAPATLKPNVDEGLSRTGGAVALYALRQKVGPATFEKIERTFLERFRDKSPSTSDYINTASDVASTNLRGFLTPWLYGKKTPSMPGHPGWTSKP